MSNSALNAKLREYFDEMIVYKDIKKLNFFKTLSMPSFLRDWLLKKFSDENGYYDMHEIEHFVHKNIPKKDRWSEIKGRLIDGERVRLLAKISVHIDIQTGEKMFELSDYGLNCKETCIDGEVWERSRQALTKANEVWGQLELGYRHPQEGKKDGRVVLYQFRDFCPYTLDLEYYKDVRQQFSIEEWIDVILGAIDYNPAGYENENQKLAMLKRLLPFIEKRLNLIELAPKGTGKSTLFGNISKYGWLASGGVMSRAKLIYDMSNRREGLIAFHDFVALDEIQTITFTDPTEIQGALKGYLENGKARVGNHEYAADAGMILLGNIPQDAMDESRPLFRFLPSAFRESALIDRFHGFIRGWDIPRMHDDLISASWGLNSEYFSSIMHMFRDDASYRCIIDDIVIEPEKADTRHNEAIKRIATAWLKLLFPHVRSKNDISREEFEKYCFEPAYNMRLIIWQQLAMIDAEYANKYLPEYEFSID